MLTLTPQPRWLQTSSETFGRKKQYQETGRRASLLSSLSKANSKTATTVVGSHCCKYHEFFDRLLFCRLYPAVDQKVRQGQAGFRRGRGCIDQIFALRNIIEQSLEWDTALYNLVTTFDSVHPDTPWKIKRTFGIPAKMITVIRHHSECSVIVTEEFSGFSFPNLKILILPMTWLFSPQSTSIWRRKQPLRCSIPSGWKHYSLRTNI